MFRRHSQASERTPHPNARVEVALQQIISLRRAAARNEQLLDQYRDYVKDMTNNLRRRTGKMYNEERNDWHEEIERLNHESNRLNNETAELHSQIGELCAKLSDDDLLWLDAQPEPRGSDEG